VLLTVAYMLDIPHLDTLGDKMPDISLDQMLAGASRGCWLLSTDGSATNWHAAELDED
jgi:hypothetical protein